MSCFSDVSLRTCRFSDFIFGRRSKTVIYGPDFSLSPLSPLKGLDGVRDIVLARFGLGISVTSGHPEHGLYTCGDAREPLPCQESEQRVISLAVQLSRVEWPRFQGLRSLSTYRSCIGADSTYISQENTSESLPPYS